MMGSGKSYRREFIKLEKALPKMDDLGNPSSKKQTSK